MVESSRLLFNPLDATTKTTRGYMFKEVVFEENESVGIPLYESNEYRWLTWGDDETERMGKR